MSNEDNTEQVTDETVIAEGNSGVVIKEVEPIIAYSAVESVPVLLEPNERQIIIRNRYNLFSAVPGSRTPGDGKEPLDLESLHIDAHTVSDNLLLAWKVGSPEESEIVSIALQLFDNNTHFTGSEIQVFVRRMVELINDGKLTIHPTPMILW